MAGRTKDVLSTILKTGKLPSPQVVGAESEEEDASRGLKQLALLINLYHAFS